jgi:hypothetical protein
MVMKLMRSFAKFSALLLASLVLTLGSLVYHRSYVPRPCPPTVPLDYGPCGLMVPRGRFPLSYVYDLQDISVQGTLGMADLRRLWPFLSTQCSVGLHLLGPRALWQRFRRLNLQIK